MNRIAELQNLLKWIFNLETPDSVILSTFSSVQRQRMATKFIAITLTAAIVGSSVTSAMAFGPETSQVPNFVRELTPPASMGYLDSYFKGNTERPVILMEDLHANYGVQKNIEAMLNLYQSKQANKPMVIGIEGYEGPADISYTKQLNRKALNLVLDYLLKEADTTATGHFAALSDKPVDLVGIDSKADYAMHRNLIRKSMVARLNLADKVDALTGAMEDSRSQAPKGLKRIWKIETAFHEGTFDLTELASHLGTSPLKDYGAAEKAIYNKKMAEASQGDKAEFWVNFVRADQNLQLLSRLFRQQLTLEEVQFATQQIPEILNVIQNLNPTDNMSEWKDAIKAAIDYYAIALMRDQPLSEHTYALAQAHPDQSIVAVTGGFHTAGIAEYLRSKNMSYVMIAPVVVSQTLKDEELYLKRMMGIHTTSSQISQMIRSQAITQTATAGDQVVESPTVIRNTVLGIPTVGRQAVPARLMPGEQTVESEDSRQTDIVFDVTKTGLVERSSDRSVTTEERELVDAIVAAAVQEAPQAELLKSRIGAVVVRIAQIGQTSRTDFDFDNGIAYVTISSNVLKIADPKERQLAFKLIAHEEAKWLADPAANPEERQKGLTTENITDRIRELMEAAFLSEPNGNQAADVVGSAIRTALRNLNVGFEGGVPLDLTNAFLTNLEVRLKADGRQANVEDLVTTFVGAVVDRLYAKNPSLKKVRMLVGVQGIEGRIAPPAIDHVSLLARIKTMRQNLSAVTAAEIESLKAEVSSYLESASGAEKRRVKLAAARLYVAAA